MASRPPLILSPDASPSTPPTTSSNRPRLTTTMVQQSESVTCLRRWPIPAQTTPQHDAAGKDGRGAYVLQCQLSVELYERLRRQSTQTGRSMNQIALTALTAYRTEVEAGHTTVGGPPRMGGATVKYNLYVGEADGGIHLHDWLRTTAFHARTSINTLVVAALAHAPAAAAARVAAAEG